MVGPLLNLKLNLQAINKYTFTENLLIAANKFSFSTQTACN